jgi:hypothetical protein
MRPGGRNRAIGLVATGASIAILLLGCGDGDDGNSAPPFVASDFEVRAECLFGTYLPERVGWRAAERPPPRNWRKIEDAPGALQPDRAAVALTIRPKRPGESIELTGVRLRVDHHSLRPIGSVFYRPCKRTLEGPAIEADIDGPGRIEATSAALHGTIGPGLRLPDNAQPIEFPWTLSLDRPMRIYLIAHTEHCFCTWSAHIPWRSESSEGTIHVDNGGRGYTATDTIGITWYRPGANERWVQLPAPTWTGVR